MAEQPADANDSPSLPVPALLAWKVARFVMRFLWNLMLGVIASVGAALLLLAGISAVLGFGVLGLTYAIALFWTAVNLFLVFLASAIVSWLLLVAIARVLVFVSTRRAAVISRWRLHRIQRLFRRAVRGIRRLVRTRSKTYLAFDFLGIILMMAVTLMIAYLRIRDPKSWNETLNVRLPTRTPVGRVGRSENPPQVSKLADVARYVSARRDKVAVKANAMTILAVARGEHPLLSRCGSTLPLQAAEAGLIAEVYVDLTQAPPIVKRKYILTEEQLTVTLSLLLIERSANFTLDCVKLHRNYIQFFTTSVDDGVSQNQELTVSLIKEAGSLRMVIDELSIGRASFQVGWLGLGVTGGRAGFMSDTEGAELLADLLRTFDSRVFTIDVFEGYVRIITWRLPSVVAARAAIDVGHTQESAELRVDPTPNAASLGIISTDDLVYVIQHTDDGYTCARRSAAVLAGYRRRHLSA